LMTARLFPDEPVVGLDQAEKNHEGSCFGVPSLDFPQRLSYGY
jgi:hypothetical protein